MDLTSVVCNAWAIVYRPETKEQLRNQPSSPLLVICRNVVLVNEGSQLLLPKPRNDLCTPVLAQLLLAMISRLRELDTVVIF